MCGISVVIRRRLNHNLAVAQHGTTAAPSLCTSHDGGIDLQNLSEMVARRGPDVTCRLTTHLTDVQTSLDAQGSVLHMRGTTARHQPAQCGDGAKQLFAPPPSLSPCSTSENTNSWLLWNGEVFGGRTVVVPPSACDTDCVLDALTALEIKWFPPPLPATTSKSSAMPPVATGDDASRQQQEDGFMCDVRNVLEGIEGPYAMIYFAASVQLVVYSRDPTGRRSLVVHRQRRGQQQESSQRANIVSSISIHSAAASSEEEEWIVSSVAGKHLGAPTLHCFDKKNDGVVEGATRQDGEDCEGGGSGDGCARGCWEEVPADGVYAIVLTAAAGADGVPPAVLRHFPWHEDHSRHPAQRPPTATVLCGDPSPMVDRVLAAVRYPHDAGVDASVDSARTYLTALAEAVRIRVVPHTTGSGGDDDVEVEETSSSTSRRRQPVALLFSGGIDSTVLAALTHYALPLDVPIELINVAFGDYPEQTPDRIGCVLAMHELLALPSACCLGNTSRPSHQRQQQREWRLVLVDVPTEESLAHQPHILNLIYPRTSVMDLNIGTAIWFAARGRGTTTVRLASRPRDTDGGVVGLSGGGEASLHNNNKLLRIAATTTTRTTATTSTSGDDKFQPLVDVLILEGFDGNGDQGGNVLLSTLGKEYGDVLTPVWVSMGYRKLGPYLNDAAQAGAIVFGGGATSKFVRLKRQDDIDKAKQRVAGGRVASLAPFAISTDAANNDDGPYCCQSKVLLAGMGADETLGGYMRYRRVFERQGLDGLKGEMQRDYSRLWTRNLGRDDRMLSDHGREGRFPFLDEGVLRTLGAIAAASDAGTCGLANIVDVGMPEGVGDKKILRTCARMLGLNAVSKLQKRAIQFGTRVANRKVQGNAKLQALCRPEAVPLEGCDGSGPATMVMLPVAAASSCGPCSKRPRNDGDVLE